MRTLLIDNYDSFTWNLFQLVAEINGEPPLVVPNDAPLEAVRQLRYDSVILSPGPGRPERAGDFGVCGTLLEIEAAPLLGVCLGHQGLVHRAGGRIVHAPEPRHGRLSTVRHDGSALFRDVPEQFQVVRYHSLIAALPLPDTLAATAWTLDGIVMALQHRSAPRWGVQFHPESIATEHGRTLLQNFRDRAHAAGRRACSYASLRPSAPASRAAEAAEVRPYQVHARRLEGHFDPEAAFVRLFGDAPNAFWLDSSDVEESRSRFSFVGAASRVASYRVASADSKRELLVTEDSGGGGGDAEPQRLNESIFAFLARELDARSCASPPLPFDFCGGFVGWFGYELKADCGGPPGPRSPTPDAAWMLIERFIAFDHLEHTAWLVALAPRGEAAGIEPWMGTTEKALRHHAREPLSPAGPAGAPVVLQPHRSQGAYLDAIDRCKGFIRDGESYELCLTNELRGKICGEGGALDDLALYRTLRRVNPAPYAAFLRVPGVAVLCSSPERFLKVDRDGHVESKPIKGTRPRGSTAVEDARLRDELGRSEKDRAENLMIVDLVRNDLGRICEVGSVHVPALMDVETYGSVHQLVSTIRGSLRPPHTALDLVQSAFPGGSMTGAPKLRTMALLDELESRPRGIYSGAIGYLSVNGAADLNIVIRSLVRTGDTLSIGIGGAIVAQSEAQDELDETMVKARPLLRALRLATGG